MLHMVNRLAKGRVTQRDKNNVCSTGGWAIAMAIGCERSLAWSRMSAGYQSRLMNCICRYRTF